MTFNKVKVLTIGAFDCHGKTGIHSDVKILSSLDCETSSVITLLPLIEINKIFAMQTECIAEQCKTILEHSKIDAVKIGKIFNTETVLYISDILRFYKPKTIVLNTSCNFNYIAEYDQFILDAIKTQMIRITDTAIFNKSTASMMLYGDVHENKKTIDIAYDILELGCNNVIIKEDSVKNIYNNSFLITKDGLQEWLYVNDEEEEVSMCKFSAALTAYMAHGYFILDSASHATKYTNETHVNNIRKYDVV